MTIRILIGFMLFTGLFGACGEKRYPDALSPEESIKTFDLHEDFSIELFAAEPHVWDPVEMIVDERGRVFVVEMPDYPYKPEEGKGRGRIRMLMDNDGDGVVDESVVFADGLPDATSMLPWKGGLIVTSAPHIFYLKDTDGDGKADVKEVLFKGFFEHNSEAQITNLTFGIDNWIYAANSGQPGEVTYLKNPSAGVVDMRGADFRFRLDTDQFETESGTAQFGMALDDWNNKFFTQNTLHIQQAVVPRRYLERHGHLSSMNVSVNISDHDFEMFQRTPPPYWRAERTRRRNIQYQEQNLDRVEHADNYFTGASGGTIYHGDAFPEKYIGNVFTGEVAGNLIHRDVLVKDKESAVFVAKRAPEEQDREFLASTDSWFRPTNFTVGPDGYLYVVDFYRQHIETPVSIPDDLKEDMDFMNGEHHGRIYRIKPKADSGNRTLAVDLTTRSAEELVDLLAHPNGWHRLNAQRLLLESPDLSVKTKLEEMVKNHPEARTKLHAAYTLDGMNSLTAGAVASLLDSSEPEAQRHALQLAERFPELSAKIRALTASQHATVALQALLSLGNFTDNQTVETLAEQLNSRGEDRWFRVAALSASTAADTRLVAALLRSTRFFSDTAEWKTGVISEIGHILGSKADKAELEKFVGILGKSDLPNSKEWQAAGLEGTKRGLKKHEQDNAGLKAALESVSEVSEEPQKQLLELINSL